MPREALLKWQFAAWGTETLENTGEKSLSVTLSRGLAKVGEWCALQGLNLRPLPCEGNALPLS